MEGIAGAIGAVFSTFWGDNRVAIVVAALIVATNVGIAGVTEKFPTEGEIQANPLLVATIATIEGLLCGFPAMVAGATARNRTMVDVLDPIRPWLAIFSGTSTLTAMGVVACVPFLFIKGVLSHFVMFFLTIAIVSVFSTGVYGFLWKYVALAGGTLVDPGASPIIVPSGVLHARCSLFCPIVEGEFSRRVVAPPRVAGIILELVPAFRGKKSSTRESVDVRFRDLTTAEGDDVNIVDNENGPNHLRVYDTEESVVLLLQSREVGGSFEWHPILPSWMVQQQAALRNAEGFPAERGLPSEATCCLRVRPPREELEAVQIGVENPLH